MNDIIREVLIALVGALILAFQRWKAQRDFENTRGQNQALKEIQDKVGIEPSAPQQPSRRRRASMLLPRAPTPLPFWPVSVDAVPEAVDAERTTDKTKGVP